MASLPLITPSDCGLTQDSHWAALQRMQQAGRLF
jgi:hypothetical protein